MVDRFLTTYFLIGGMQHQKHLKYVVKLFAGKFYLLGVLLLKVVPIETNVR